MQTIYRMLDMRILLYCQIFLARYHRLVGEETYFLTGTDEHGAKNCRSAEEKGKDVKEFVDGNAQKFKELFKILNISNDDFIRTTDKEKHWPG